MRILYIGSVRFSYELLKEIIDLRDRIEQMRIQIENEATEQISVDRSPKAHENNSNSNISLSMENKNISTNQNFEVKEESIKLENIIKKDNKEVIKNETFPAVSLSVKNPVSSKILILLVTLQILSNIGILYFLYLGME